jgi:hypothetical protein
MRWFPQLTFIAFALCLCACDSQQDKIRSEVPSKNGAPEFDVHNCMHDAKATVQFPPNGCMVSPNGAYVLVMRHSGVLDITTAADGAAGKAPIWTTGARGAKPDSAQAVFQGDGNLVIYDQPGQHAIWNSQSSGTVGTYVLALSDSGNLTITDAAGKTIWRSGFFLANCAPSMAAGTPLPIGGCIASPSKTYALVMRMAGSLDLAPVKPDGSTGDPIWTSGSRASAPGSAAGAFQTDGNLVVYDQPGSRPIWNSESSGPTGAYRLELNDAGEIKILNAEGKAIWSSKTGHSPKT